MLGDIVQAALNRLSENPRLWVTLRAIAENGFRTEREIIARELVASDGTRTAYLDFGCGTGVSAEYFPPGTYTGFDIAHHYVRYASRQGRGRYAVMSGGALGFDTACFDGALVLGVFHHLPDELVRASVAELHRVLRPGARLLVMEDIPSPRPWNILGHTMHWLDRGDHIRTDADYRALLAPHFLIRRSYQVRSGICDLAVYVLDRAGGPGEG
ncbi:MAG TPA: class I SAM-dependent methyltransferase [Roseiflexaceae bacterium]|nr:class I SAM-dependent methyltransferase [Roseiflexaceae bacterium]